MTPDMTPYREPWITQEALDRLASDLRRELNDFKVLAAERHAEMGRRLLDLNNSHDKAILEKQRTDEAATRIQERAVTKADLQLWRDEVERRFNIMAGAATTAATVRATLLSVGIGVLMVALNFLIRFAQ
jgi:hypothetical protein